MHGLLSVQVYGVFRSAWWVKHQINFSNDCKRGKLLSPNECGAQWSQTWKHIGELKLKWLNHGIENLWLWAEQRVWWRSRWVPQKDGLRCHQMVPCTWSESAQQILQQESWHVVSRMHFCRATLKNNSVSGWHQHKPSDHGLTNHWSAWRGGPWIHRQWARNGLHIELA